MEVIVKFAGGPLDGQQAYTDSLQAAKIFFDERERRVFLYTREDELAYGYSGDKSKELTERYDEAKAFFVAQEPASLGFIEPDGEDEE